MKKVLLICKAKDDPSSYYRLGQYLDSNKNVHCVYMLSGRQYRSLYGCRETVIKKLMIGFGAACRIAVFILWDVCCYHSSTVIVNRKIVPRYCPVFLGAILDHYLRRRFVIWDVDDNIFESGEITRLETKLYEKLADRIVVSTPFLKAQLHSSLWRKTEVLYTTDRDLEEVQIQEWNAVRKKLFNTRIHLLWAGTKGNLHYLDAVIGQLDQAAGELAPKKVTLYVVSSMRYLRKTSYMQIRNIRWTRDGLLRMMPYMHIGIMPLLEDAFTKGKAAFKTVQYIGAGLPVIASPVGFNGKVVQNGVNGFLTEKGWGSCLKLLAGNDKQWEAYALRARGYWEQNFNGKYNAAYWEDLMKRDV